MLPMDEKVSNFLKWTAKIVIPALVTFISSVAVALNLDATAVVAIVAAVNVLIGSVCGISTSLYKKNLKDLEDFTE